MCAIPGYDIDLPSLPLLASLLACPVYQIIMPCLLLLATIVNQLYLSSRNRTIVFPTRLVLSCLHTMLALSIRSGLMQR